MLYYYIAVVLPVLIAKPRMYFVLIFIRRKRLEPVKKIVDIWKHRRTK